MFYFLLDFYKKEVIVSSMKPTQKNTISYVKQMLSTNKVWALKALVRIYQENQTADEQVAKTTSHDNGIGFSGVDAAFASSLAEGYLKYGKLSDKQMTFVHRIMPKYAGQVVKMSDEAKLAAMVEATPEPVVAAQPKIHANFNAYLQENFRSECE